MSTTVRDPLKPPPKLKLVAKGGKLEIDKEEVGQDPNGTAVMITTRTRQSWTCRRWWWGGLWRGWRWCIGLGRSKLSRRILILLISGMAVGTFIYVQIKIVV